MAKISFGFGNTVHTVEIKHGDLIGLGAKEVKAVAKMAATYCKDLGLSAVKEIEKFAADVNAFAKDKGLELKNFYDNAKQFVKENGPTITVTNTNTVPNCIAIAGSGMVY